MSRSPHQPLHQPPLSQARQPATASTVAPFSDADLLRLDELLQSVPAPLQALDLSALDGYLCGVLLQAQRPPPSRWWPFVADVEGRPLPAGARADELFALVRRRHAELDQAIAQRQWFDPWIYGQEADAEQAEDAQDTADGVGEAGHDASDPSDPSDPAQAVLPWVAGFAAAMEHFPDLMAMTDPALVEPLALLFMHFDANDLEDADALLAVIETLEPPADLPEAVQDLVRALMLIADVTRPPSAAAAKPRPGPVRRGATRSGAHRSNRATPSIPRKR